MTRLLVSVRGPTEALAAAMGGAQIADVEYPTSALGTPYPLNIKAVRDHLDDHGYSDMPISTNIGEEQDIRSAACQAALGVATAGADFVKCGLARLDLGAATYLGRNLVRTVREWYPAKRVYPAVFPDEELAKVFDPLRDGPKLVRAIDADGLLIDTFDKANGQGLLDYYDVGQISEFVWNLHDAGKEAWIAGSISKDQLQLLARTEVDVICVRGAACEPQNGNERLGTVRSSIVQELVRVMTDFSS